MPRRSDIRGKSLILGLVGGVVLALLLVGGGLFLLSMPSPAAIFEPGMGLKTAAVVAFFVTLALFVVLAITAGDGLLGELQYMIAGFGSFFVVLWLMIAWIF